MLFNSLEFLLFFPIVLIVYFLCPHRFRWIFLLGASYYFYMCWKPEYILLILASTAIDYFVGIQLGKTIEQAVRKRYLWLSLCANLGLLFSFKYLNFFSASLQTLLERLGLAYTIPHLNVLLPVGISFYTFQTLSYTIDVFRGEREPERHPGIFALYVAFFPQLVAGPIERSTSLMPQFRNVVRFDFERLTDGLRLMLWGFFKKLVIADRVAVAVETVYHDPASFSSLQILIATYLFAFQIYCDFSGYTDIARGAAWILGFDLMENFKRPYFAQSLSDFWKRWHISLSTWFRDYVYIPLGGNRVVKWRWYYNLLIVFVLSGFWHGANWTFLAWGAVHGVYLICGIMTKNFRQQMAKTLKISNVPFLTRFVRTCVTFHLVVFAWIFFRANTISDALYIVRRLLVDADFSTFELVGLNSYEWIVTIMAILFMELVHSLQEYSAIRQTFSKTPVWLRLGMYYALIMLVIIWGKFDHREFIYFQF